MKLTGIKLKNNSTNDMEVVKIDDMMYNPLVLTKFVDEMTRITLAYKLSLIDVYNNKGSQDGLTIKLGEDCEVHYIADNISHNIRVDLINIKELGSNKESIVYLEEDDENYINVQDKLLLLKMLCSNELKPDETDVRKLGYGINTYEYEGIVSIVFNHKVIMHYLTDFEAKMLKNGHKILFTDPDSSKYDKEFKRHISIAQTSWNSNYIRAASKKINTSIKDESETT